jgi:glycosyltransferase involved in cell wall biosynthesis
MACGVPVLISEHVNLAADITEARTGWVVKLDNAGLLDALQDALRNEQKRVGYGVAARELVRARFTWPAVANELMDLYSEITRNRSLLSHELHE